MLNLFGHLAGDRRSAQRHHLNIPVRYRVRDSKSEYSSHTENVSEVGLFFETEHLLSIGTVLDLLLDLPNASSGGLASLWCTGRVVRVCSTGEKRGMGVEFDCFEVVDSKLFAYGSVLPVAS